MSISFLNKIERLVTKCTTLTIYPSHIRAPMSPITDWPENERPREKLLARGAAALSDAELLAIFLRTGVVGISAVDLARSLLTRFGSLTALFAAPREVLEQSKGMGDAKYAQLQAVLEMARRALAEELKQGAALTSAAAACDYLRLHLAHLTYEAVVGVFLNAQHHVISIEELAKGTLSQSQLYPREVAKQALALNAAALILAHNHPSGHAKASQADIDLTQQLRTALATLDIHLLDHVIVAGHQTLSLATAGLMQ